MNNIKILDCTLRDGGYVNDWTFGDDAIRSVISDLMESRMDYIECGYISNREYKKDRTVFKDLSQISEFLPERRSSSQILVMADVQQCEPCDIPEFDGKSVDGIRVVFYKHQIDKALPLIEDIAKKGYKVFVQPMVTMSYSMDEYRSLIDKINKMNVFAVAIVDSFGFMTRRDILRYLDILDAELSSGTGIGIHLHNNMQMALHNALLMFEYDGCTNREVIIDASVYGMGRGAGNLCTELITYYYNSHIEEKYNVEKIMDIISSVLMPIYKETPWGYSPYMLLTAMNQCHPNYAVYLLQNHMISISEFADYIKKVLPEMKCKCTKALVEELFVKHMNRVS